MKVQHLTVHWHQDTAPIYSAKFQPHGNRLATSGGDKYVRLWRLPASTKGPHNTEVNVEFIAGLAFHDQAVNAVAWNTRGDLLASAGDDGVVCLWRQTLASTDGGLPSGRFGTGEEDQEQWKMIRRSNAIGGEVYDLAWSPSGQFLAAASMDNCVRIYDAVTCRIVHTLESHGHYVQGVAWDPLGAYLATQSSDRSLLVYKVEEKAGSIHLKGTPTRISRADLPEDRVAVYHNETFSSFFRRLSFSPDGALLITPAGQVRPNTAIAEPSTPQSCVLVYSRHTQFNRPVALLPEPKQCLCVSFNPRLFALRSDQTTEPVVRLPYRIVYAVALQNSVVVYDTQQSEPLGQISNLHYSPLTDLSWSPDGSQLLLSSIDGFCSVLIFDLNDKGDLGLIYEGPLPPNFTTVPAPLEELQVQKPQQVHTLVARKKKTATAT